MQCLCVCVFNGTIFIKKASSVPKAEWPVLSLWTIIIAEGLPFLSLPRRHLPSSQRDSCKTRQFTRPVSMVYWNMNKNPGHFFHFYYKAHEKKQKQPRTLSKKLSVSSTGLSSRSFSKHLRFHFTGLNSPLSPHICWFFISLLPTWIIR